MTDSPLYEAMREFVRSTVQLEVALALRNAPAGLEPVPGPQGPQGEPGPAGERGADGAAGLTREEMEALIEERFEELQVRTLADSYRNVFAAGEEYQRGDLVTHEGSLWMALADTGDSPGTSEGWRMITKRGRDGRDRRG